MWLEALLSLLAKAKVMTRPQPVQELNTISKFFTKYLTYISSVIQVPVFPLSLGSAGETKYCLFYAQHTPSYLEFGHLPTIKALKYN